MPSPSRYRQRKDRNQSEIVKALESIGCDVYVLHTPCDLLVCVGSRNLLLEVKDGAKVPSARKLTPDQIKFHASARGQKAVVTSVDEAIRVVTGGT